MFPDAAKKQFSDTLKKSVIYSATKVSNNPIKIGSDIPAGFVEGRNYIVNYDAGDASPADDTGTISDYFIPNILNIDDVIKKAAQPLISEIGPISYREYEDVDTSCAKCGYNADVMTWYNRKIVRFNPVDSHADYQIHTSGSKFDTTYVTVPNLNYHGLEAYLKLLSSGQIATLESLTIPLFFAQGMSQLLSNNALPLLFRTVTMPIVFGAMINTLVTTNSASYAAACPSLSGAALTTCITFQALKDFRSNATGATGISFSLGQDISTGATSMSDTALGILFCSLSPSLVSSGGWSLLAAALQGAGKTPPDLSGVTAFSTAFATACASASDPTYVSNPTKLASHVGLIMTWVGTLLSPTTTSGGALSTPAAATAFNFLKGFVNFLAVPGASLNDYSELGYLQLGSNSIMPLLAYAAGTTSATASMGTSVANECPSTLGASLIDTPSLKANIPGGAIPEFSCWNARSNPNSLGSRLSPSQMKAWFTTLLSGQTLSLGGNVVPGSNGFTTIAAFMQGGNALAKAFATAAATAVAGGTPAADMLQTLNIAVLYRAYLTSKTSSTSGAYDTAVAAASNCPAAYNPLSLSLKCSQILDLLGYVSHVSQNLVFNPTFVNVGPRISDGSGGFKAHTDPYWNALANEATPLRAGPFLRCTVREILEKGCHDNLQEFALGALAGKPPGDPSNRLSNLISTSYEGASRKTAFDLDYVNKVPDLVNGRYTGSSDLNQIDVIQADSGRNGPFLEFGGPLGDTSKMSHPLDGSYSGNQFKPELDINFWDSPKDLNSVKVWVWQVRRSVDLVFVKKVEDPTGAGIKLRRFALPDVLPKMKTDDPATLSTVPYYGRADVFSTPTCAVNILPIANSVPVFVASPYFQPCHMNNVSGYNYSSPNIASHTATRELNTYIDIEPITGLVMNGFKRLGVHIAWKASPWFNLKTTYGLAYWVQIRGAIKSDRAKTFALLLKTVKSLMADSFAGMIAVGVISLFVSTIFFYFGWIVPKTGTAVSTDEQTNPNFGGENPLSRKQHAGESSV